MPKLYELTGDYAKLVELEDDLDPTLFHDTLDSITDSIEDKAVGYAKVINQFTSDAKQLKAEEERLAKRRTALDHKIKILKDALTEAMQATNNRKFKTPEFTIWIQDNPKKLVVDEELSLPNNFFHVERKLDKKALKEAMEYGKEFDGAHFEQTKGLRIK